MMEVEKMEAWSLEAEMIETGTMEVRMTEWR